MIYYNLLFFVIPVIIGIIGSINAKHKLKKYGNIFMESGMNSNLTVRNMLYDNGCQDVAIYLDEGSDNDFFNPKDNSITLSSVGNSVSDVAVGVHEVGHAIQMKEGYSFFKLRNAIFPVVNLCNTIWFLFIILGFAFQMTNLVWIGIAIFCVILFWNLITLPLEFNASKRGLEYLQLNGATNNDLIGAKKVLNACAMTYVIATLISILQLLALLARNR